MVLFFWLHVDPGESWMTLFDPDHVATLSKQLSAESTPHGGFWVHHFTTPRLISPAASLSFLTWPWLWVHVCQIGCPPDTDVSLADASEVPAVIEILLSLLNRSCPSSLKTNEPLQRNSQLLDPLFSSCLCDTLEMIHPPLTERVINWLHVERGLKTCCFQTLVKTFKWNV